MKLLVVMIVAVLLVLVSARAMAVEEPSYKVLNTFEDFEVRQYPPYVVAETLAKGSYESAGDSAFSRLAGYIFGENQGGNSIAMTAPVAQMPVRLDERQPVTQIRQSATQSAEDAEFLVQFAMPADMTLQTLPKPNDTRVVLRELPERKLAVIRYSGNWTEKEYQKQLQKLKSAMQQQGMNWQGEPIWARYNSPWMPSFMRRNEIFLQLK
jgi:hypothetical protein